MQVIAHRGAKGYVSENTLAAFEKALDMNVSGIELDVFLSADGEIIVFHDEHLNRLCGVEGSVSEFTLPELRTLKVDRLYPIPTLAEVFDLVDQKCLINIEIKTESAAKPVTELVEKYATEKSWDYTSFLISSFDWTTLRQIRNWNANIPLGILTETDLDLAIGFAKSIQAEAIHPYYHLLDTEAVRKIKAENLLLNTWTVNVPEDISRIKSLGVDGIITDYPDRI